MVTVVIESQIALNIPYFALVRKQMQSNHSACMAVVSSVPPCMLSLLFLLHPVCSIFVCVMVVVGILWIPVIQGMQGACQFCATVYIVTVVSVAPCVCSIFVCVMVVVGILWIPVIQGMQGAHQFCATVYIITIVSVAPCV